MIAEACVGLGLQLVISLGGGKDPALLGDLPGDPVVVGFAPQLELIRRAALTISHGGLNTALKSLAQGVPMVVLPVTYDQPGVGVRVERAGVGRSIPTGRVTVGRLRNAVCAVLGDPTYRKRAGVLQSSIEAADGLNRAADVIGAAFGLYPRQPRQVRSPLSFAEGVVALRRRHRAATVRRSSDYLVIFVPERKETVPTGFPPSGRSGGNTSFVSAFSAANINESSAPNAKYGFPYQGRKGQTRPLPKPRRRLVRKFHLNVHLQFG